MSRVARRALAAALPLVLAATLLNAPGTSAAPERRPAATGGITYGYDAAGRLTSVVDPGGTGRTFAYDAVGNLTSITAGAGGGARPAAAARTTRITGLHAAFRAGGARGSIVLTGSGLPLIRDAAVKLGGLFATVTSARTGRLVVEVPDGLAPGRRSVRVGNSSGAIARTSVRLPGVVASPPAPVAPLPWLRAPIGVTAISGRVRDSHTGKGLGGVEVAVDDVEAHTRADGRFLLRRIPAGHHELEIDASTPRHAANHGSYEVGVDAVAGRTVRMPWTTWLTAVDTAHAVRLPADPRHEIVVTSPSMPGLSVHVPAHTRLTDDDGNRVTWLSITRMPLNRQPFPGAPGMTLAWTIQPGDATVSGSGLRVVYPNLAHQPPGTKIDYVDHDADRFGTGWSVYGSGRVTPDGRHIAPDRHTRLHKTYQLGVSYNPLCQYLGIFCPHTGDDDSDGDPVDLQTGLFVFSRTDLVEPDVLPLALTRTYRQNDNVVRSFGIGQSDGFNSFVAPDGQGHYVVQLPDGSSVPFSPTSEPTVYNATATPNALTGATMTTDNHQNFTVTMATGRVLSFGGETASLVSITDRFGNKTTMTRDSGGRLTRVQSPNGRWITITWGACTTSAQCIVGVKDNLGRTLAYGYDASGRLISVTDPAGKKTAYAWAGCTDARTCTQLVSITDPLGATFVSNVFDANGRVESQRQANGATYSFAYDLADDGHTNATTVTDPRGVQRQVIFDSSGYSASDTAAYGTTLAQPTTVTRDAAHRVVSSTDALGRVATTTYDANGNVLSVTTQAGTTKAATDTFTYEPVYDRVATATDPLGHKTTFTYDDDAQTITATDPLGRTTSATLSEGQPVATTDELGNTDYTSYLDGEPVTAVDALGRTSHSYFDPGGRLLKLTDALGDRTSFTYDVMNDQLSSADPLGDTSRSAYDADGQLTSATDPLGHKTSYTYDALGRVVSSTDALGKTQSATYDPDGNTATSTDRLGTKNVFTYDALNRPKLAGYKAVGTGASTTYQSTVTNTFDAGNRLTKAVDTTGGTVTRAYDTADRVTSETTSQGGTAYTYDLAGRRTGMTVTGQPKTTYTYNNDNQLTGIANGVGTVALTYDADGRQLSKTLPGGVKQTWAYDAGSQLTGITYAHGATTLGTLTYGYDAAGRRTGVGGTYARTGLPATVASSTYNADNALTARGPTTYTYDADGQLTGGGGSTYSWNARHQLVGTGGSVASSYTYDPLGRRLTRTVGSSTTGFVYDGSDLVQERTGSASANLLTGLGTDQTYARQDSAGTTGLLTDALGSTVALTTSAGAVGTSYTYDPFGAVTSTGTANGNPLKWTGRESDGTGLQYNRARYYSPTLERFISQDPAGANGSGDNLYAYAGDSPTNGTDPSGEFGLIGCAVGAGISVLGGFLIHKLSGQKYTFTDGLIDAGVGCLFGAIDNVGGIAENLEREAAEDAAVAAEREAAEDAATSAEREGAACGGESFTRRTRVVMADGSTEPLDRIRVGDRVRAYDPARGRTVRRTVSRVWVNRDTDLLDVRIRSHGATSVIHSTQRHPFWDATGSRWTTAARLRPGDRVRTVDGSVATVAALTVVAGAADMWDLTVATSHDFYVVSGAASVLVHNCGGRFPDAALDSTGKVHGDLPSPADLGEYDPEALGMLRDELEQSVQTRIAKTVELGADYGHNERLAAEQQLIKSIDKYLADH